MMLSYIRHYSGSALAASNGLNINQLLDFSSLQFSAINTFVHSSLTSKEWLTSEEASEYLGIPVESLRNMTSNGKIPYYKVPGTRSNRYRQAELRELLLQSRKGEAYGN